MKVLVIGGGGREHALVWKLRQSAGVEKVWCAPGNGGISAEAECVAADAGNVSALVALAEKISPDLTVVGPELPLVNGLTDAFRQRKYAVVGPVATSGTTRRQQNLRKGVPAAAQRSHGGDVWLLRFTRSRVFGALLRGLARGHQS